MDREISQTEFYDRFPEEVPSNAEIEEVTGSMISIAWDNSDEVAWRSWANDFDR